TTARMGGRGNNRFLSRNLLIQAKPDGSRQYYEHDDRGCTYRGSGSSERTNGGGARGRANSRDFYRNSGKFRGRVWDGDYGNDRSTRLPEGHWRGDRRPSGRGLRNLRAPRYQDEDIEMKMNRDRNRRQDMYKSRGGRRVKDFKGSRGPQNANTSNLGWHKILIQEGIELDKNEVLESIRNLVHEPFTPILHDCLKRVMSERYTPDLRQLNLNNFHNDINLIKEGIFCPLYRQLNMQLVVNIIVENIPQVHEIDLSQNKIQCLDDLVRLVPACPDLQKLNLGKNKILNLDTLEKLVGLNLTELTLEGNPLCNQFRDTELYISAVRKFFSKVVYLDRQQLPRPIGFEVDEDESKIPKTVPAYFILPDVKDLVLQFIEQYYQIFDTEDRKPLEAAYSKNALFSLTCNFPDTGPGSRFSNIYLTENRNLKKLGSSNRRQKLVFQGRSAIGNLLCKLPSTVHDPPSFTLDVPVANPKLIVVTLSGVFRQQADRLPPIRSFTRTLTIVPEGTGYCICNEQIYITTATVEQVKKAFNKTRVVAPAQPIMVSVEQIEPAPANDPGTQQATLLPMQEAMIIKFSEASGMLPQFSQLCLEQNGWDFNKAGEVFLQLKTDNKIPPEYFAQSV
ncbi:hypothetical protein OTU49_004529, partial [Cherax quadricarinatus]